MCYGVRLTNRPAETDGEAEEQHQLPPLAFLSADYRATQTELIHSYQGRSGLAVIYIGFYSIATGVLGGEVMCRIMP